MRCGDEIDHHVRELEDGGVRFHVEDLRTENLGIEGTGRGEVLALREQGDDRDRVH
jgi:hypothetical protein